ncbi:MAG: prepilin peptidase [Chloroflexia bacterium]|nr:prepilin peptidase [Chloroflexia bacterium]
MIESLTSSGNWLIQSILVVVLVAAVVFDMRARRIPHLLTFPAMAVGFLVNVAVDGGPGLAFSGAGMALGVALFVMPVALRILGAGDLKLMAAVGLIGGPALVLWSALFAVVAGGALALVVLAHK